MLPVRVARSVLPGQGDAVVYVAAGALGAAGVVEWPVAAAIGVGYGVLRRWGPRLLFGGHEAECDDDLIAVDPPPGAERA
jgi:hypothetical protein